MGFLDFFFEDEDTAKSQSTESSTGVSSTVGTEVVGQTNVETAAGQTDTATVSTVDETTQLLDEETVDELTNLISGLSGSFSEAGGTILSPSVLGQADTNIDFANSLASRAGQTENVLNQSTEDIVAGARQRGTDELNAATTRIAQGAGSNLNSIVQSANARGISDLEVQLGALRGQLGNDARLAGSQDLATAFAAASESARAGADIQIGGSTAGVQNIAQLAEVLKGAVADTTGSTTSETSTTEFDTIIAALESFGETTGFETIDNTTGTEGASSGTQRESYFDVGNEAFLTPTQGIGNIL